MIELIVIGSVCFVLGMYVTTQIGKSIEPNQNQKLIQNMNKIETDGTTNKKG